MKHLTRSLIIVFVMSVVLLGSSSRTGAVSFSTNFSITGSTCSTVAISGTTTFKTPKISHQIEVTIKDMTTSTQIVDTFVPVDSSGNFTGSIGYSAPLGDLLRVHVFFSAPFQFFDVPECSSETEVTWFDPGDDRVDPRPGDHLAAYCDFEDKTISAIVIGTNDSKGKTLTVFDLADVLDAGKQGLSVNLGTLGTVSLVGDAQGNFWMAWNGGVYRATGKGDFAKGFNCKFNQ